MKKLIITLLVIVNFLLLTVNGYSQQYNTDMSAKEYFVSGNLRAALTAYLKLLKDDPKNIDYNHKIGICYLNINDDKTKAIRYLEFVTTQNKFDNAALLDMGMAYHQAMRFDDAIKYYNKYKERAGDQDIETTDRQIEMCYNGKELVKYPLDVTFENLGKNINSSYPDYWPFVPTDESFIVYTSRRKGNRGNLIDYDGYHTSDIYISIVKKGKYSKTKNLSLINTMGDEEAVGISHDGSNLFVFLDDLYIYGDIYVSTKKGKSFQSIKQPGKNINTKSSMETAACLSPDGTLLFFASDRKEGHGGTDIYMSNKLPNGTWGIPINLGSVINTQYNEDFPSISADGKTLYFCSEGHMSMGGFDIFKSSWDEDSSYWQPPLNIGYPINTPDDNMNISFSTTLDAETETLQNKYAYVSAVRKDGFGDLDIYRITFNKVTSRFTVIKGLITSNIPVDNSEYKTFYYYEKNNTVKIIPEECHPWYDKTWKLKETKKVKVEPGYEYKTILFFTKGVEKKVFSSKKYPKNDPAYVFKSVKTTLVKKKSYQPPVNEPSFITKILSDATITITDNEKGEEFSYTPTKTGKYVIILPPGNYHIFVEVPGYESVSKDIKIFDKSSFKPEIIKNFVLKPLN